MGSYYSTLKLFLSFSLLLFCALAYSQTETCNNGIDDDGDGFVDCFDRDCKGAQNCEDDYIDGTPTCEIVPSRFPTFTMKELYKTSEDIANGLERPSVGDLDGDGIPEIVVSSMESFFLYVLDGRDGTIKNKVDIDSNIGEPVLADIEGDGKAEIFVPVGYKGNVIHAYTHDLQKKWEVKVNARAGSIGIADFDGDGKSEIYSRDMIIDAHTGTILSKSKYNLTDFASPQYIDKNITKGGVAVDILADSDCANCAGLELVNGGLIFSVKINRVTNSAEVTLEKTMPGGYLTVFHAGHNRTYSSVADLNQDGHLDVVTAGNHPTLNNTTMYFWDVKNDRVLTYHDDSVRKYRFGKEKPRGWLKGTGRPNISDINGDGKLNITFNSGVYLYALNDDMTLKWRKKVFETSSGNTGATMFDFNGDGKNEIVYRDEKKLYIIDGDGNFRSSVDCHSITWTEYPIVADVNGDGATEICVTCDTDYFGSSGTRKGLRVYVSDDELWVPARKVWNQHAYFNVNINDDLTVPRQQQLHHLVWSTNTCGNPSNRPLNSFLNQSPHLTYDGCPNYAASDLKIDGGINVKQPKCPENEFEISFKIRNDGDKNVTANIPISFYSGDPLVAGATYLNTEYRTLVIPKKTSVLVDKLKVKGPGSAFTLYIALNHDGVKGKNNNPPTPISYPSGGVLECKNDNNIASVNIKPDIFKVSVEKIKDNENCDPNNKTTSNGVAQAFVLINGVKVTAGYEFYWFNSPKPVNKAMDFSPGPIYSNLAKGTYSVTASNNNKKCSSDTVEVVIETKPTVTTHQVRIDTVQSFSDCKNPNGSLRADVYEGSTLVTNPTTKYSFAWYIGNQPTEVNKVSTDRTATGLLNREYLVVVTDKTTGCSNSESRTVPSIEFPAVTAQISPNTGCGAPSGSALASVKGDTLKYNFKWYKGSNVKPTPDHTFAKYTGLAKGTYTVTATSKATLCTSNPVKIEIKEDGQDPVLTVDVVSQDNSCDPSVKLGSAAANVAGKTAGYTFTWYKGQSTNDTDKLLPTGPTKSGLAKGTYTVHVIDNNSKCTATKEFTIFSRPISPVVTTKVNSHLTVCTTGQNNGSVTAEVNGTTNGFTFYWFDGDQSAGTPDIANPDFTGHTYSGLKAGDYTVVAYNSTTKCKSAPVKATVEDKSSDTKPTFTTQPKHITSCLATGSTGSIVISITGGTVADYDFKLFTGQNTDNANAVTATAPPTTFGGLQQGIYTVLVTHKTTGCFNTAEVTIENKVTSKPIVDADFLAPNTNCDKNKPNGKAQASVRGVIGGGANYTFKWYNGSSVKATPDFEGPDYINLAKGEYTVTVTDNRTGCVSDAVTGTIREFLDRPNITLDVTSQQTSCSINAKNGSLSANVNGATNGYTFRWFKGTSAIDANEVQPVTNGATKTGLASGTYTVLVTNTLTQCSGTSAITIENNPTKPVVTPTADKPQTVCKKGTANGDGEVSASVGGVTAGYTFYWFHGDLTGTIPDITKSNHQGATYSDIAAGVYTVVAVGDPNVNGCVSDPQKVTVIDNSSNAKPVIDQDIVHQSSCDKTKLNGQITVKITGGNVADYNISLFEGQNTLASNAKTPTTPPNIFGGLSSGIYTILAENKTNGCSSTKEVTIEQRVSLPRISVRGTGVTQCNPVNGTATASVTQGDVSDYTFSWYRGKSVKATPDFTNRTNQLTGLSAGFYAVEAFNNKTNCSTSNFALIEITNARTTKITITPNTNDRIIPARCTGAGTGRLGVNASSPGNTLGFDFSWYSGDINVGMTSIGSGNNVNNPPTHNRTDANLQSGRYTVVVTNKNTGCSDSLSIDLPFVDDHTLLNSQVSPNTKCQNYNGYFRTTVTPSKGAQALGADQTWYRLDVWLNGQRVQSVRGTNPETLIGYNQVTRTGVLAPGKYTVKAVEIDRRLNGCSSTSNEITIEDKSAPPVLEGAKTDNDHCENATDGSGSITLTIDGTPRPATGYTYKWFRGKLTSDPALPARHFPDGHTATMLKEGFYTVEVFSTISECTSSATFHIMDKPASVSFTTIAPTPDSNCDPSNGSATVTAMSLGNPNDYDFQWLAADGTTILPGSTNGSISPTNLDGGARGGNGIKYFVKATHKTSKCVASSKEFTILNTSKDPAITGTVTENTRCAVPYTGRIAVVLDGGQPATNYTFGWIDVASGNPVNVAVPSVNILNNGFTIDQIPSGKYRLEITDNLTPNEDCKATATFFVPDNPPKVAIGNITVTHDTNCSPDNGSATVTSMTHGAPSDYTFQWFLSDGVTPIAGAGDTATPITRLDGGLPTGTGIKYFVVATHRTSACLTAKKEFIIQNRTINPAIALDQREVNTRCEANYNGSISITIDKAKPATGYTIAWFDANNGDPILTSIPTARVTNNGLKLERIPAGKYRVEVTDSADPNNNCKSTATFTLSDNKPIVAVIKVEPTHDTNCSPDNGSAVVTQMSPGIPADYTYQWLASDGTTVLPGSGTGVASPTDLDGGTLGGAGIKYKVKATHTASACLSDAKEFTIENKSAKPVIKLKKAIVANTLCGNTSNGSIEIEIVGAQLPLNTNYTITWVNATTNAPLPTTSIDRNGLLAKQLLEGEYRVTVTDLLSPNQACANSATFIVPNKKASISVDLKADLESTPNNKCAAPYNGKIEIKNVKEDGVAKPATIGYTFQWKDKNKKVIPGNTNIISGLNHGIYYVSVRNNTTECVNPVAIQITVADSTKNPVITLDDFKNKERCNGANRNGMLSVLADEDINGYTFAWKDATNANVGNQPQIDGLDAGKYTVTATNTTTQCVASETYEITTIFFPVKVSASSTPVTNCSAPNGTVFAKVTTASGDFEYFWFKGNKTNPAPDLNNPDFPIPHVQERKNLEAGNYTVVARDRNDHACISDPVVTNVEESKTNPTVEIKEDAALRYCDKSRPNGQLSATADGGKISGYTFEWFNGKNTTGTPARTGSVYGRLTAGIDYTVKVTNILTGCQVEATKQVTEKFPTINSPIVKVLSHRTSCSEPNGSLIASVDGKTDGYRFKWYLGTNTNAKPIGVFPKITDLDIGIYTVVATHIITGCKASNTGEILDKRIKPEFKVRTTPASCGQPNGSIQVTSKNSTIKTIVWEIDGRKIKSLNLNNHKAGKYKFTVYSTEGCKASGEATILEDIIIYNGVSANNDGKNDHFIISCIEIFENNNVKIYNRAGQIIYEADGYNNDNVKFDGKGNKGIYLTGNDVPDGTYFYIVDKRDGSEPRTGYLELLR